MIKIKLADLLWDKHMKPAELARATKISPSIISNLIHENNTRIDLKTLDKICKVLECNVCDILEYKDNLLK